jgi:hypothetical protein
MSGKLRVEESLHCSGKIINENFIPTLKEKDYIVKNYDLDGDSPKKFIKVYFFMPDSPMRRNSANSWASYIAKTAEKWYPHESVIEYMINRIGEVMRLEMNEIKLIKINRQIRFLSRYFLNENEKLIHGAEICGEHLGDMEMAEEIANNKDTSRQLFTFEFIKEAIRSVFPQSFEDITLQFVKMLTFDALVGNNDRHFYNWGVIDTKKKTSKLPIFTPIYDSARGLLWNYSDENIVKIHNAKGQRIGKYIEEACPRVSIETNTSANHFELIDFLKRYNKDYNEIVIGLSNVDKEEQIIKMLTKEFYPLFIRERCELITLILRSRFKKIRSI